MNEPVIVEPDSRGRISLGSLVTPGRYLASADSEGRIVLEPAVVLTATEERLLADADFRTRMTAASGESAEPFDFDEL